MSESLVLRETIEDSIALLTINRPEAMNALNADVMNELYENFKKIKDEDSIKCVIITGAGDKAFVGGADIKAMKDMDASEGKKFSLYGHEIMNFIEDLKKPVIAAINGYALGGGTELALATDIRIASEDAQMGLPEITLGIFPGFGGCLRMPKLIGMAKAKELIYTGDIIGAEEAKELNLVNKVVGKDELMETATKMAKKIASKSMVAMSLAKETINSAYEETIESGTVIESSALGVCFSSEDKTEGMKAFMEKRKPEFKDK
ncbi:enoyl-CoA hydratase-related protein [Natranaerofaba carboxydovora]|uniref:enoyl-CoA hydratase-related protein n=1 Tax=Natranaerofaba carboxydovora TaxID=2742683 RepID=UPI001F14151D|nr:enoyl-CoA hydratase-related protein [Natranaerofaba carboxydovora]UMZ74343.1 Short-chain-enoyl-CoA hydratase [Natranaerofaba carboxydovora]